MAAAWFRQPRWLAVWFLTLASALNFGDRSALSAVLSALRTDFGLSDVQLGLLASTFLWSYALGSPLAGSLGDRVSRTRLVVVSLIGWSAVTALLGLATGYPMLIVLRFGLGLAECLFLPAALALVAAYHQTSTRARAMSALQIGANVGMVIGGSLAGYFADHFGWRSGFLVLGGGGVLLSAFSVFMLPAVPASAPEVPRARTGPGFWAAIGYVLRVPSYWLLLGEAMLVGLGLWIFFTWLPLYFRETYNMPLAAAGFAGTFMLQISVVLGVSAGGWFSDRVSARAPHRRMLLFGIFYVLGAPWLLLFLGRPSFPVVAFGISVFSFMRGLASANERPIQCEIVPPVFRATAVGLMNAMATAAGGCGVLLAGFLKQGIGLGGVFAGISVCFIAAAGLLFLGYRCFIRRDIARAQSFTSTVPPSPSAENS